MQKIFFFFLTMIVNFKQKFSIIHIPKTGGTSIKKSLIKILGNEIFFFIKNYLFIQSLNKDHWILKKIKILTSYLG